MNRTDLVDLVLHVHHETDAAYKVSDDGDEDKSVWLPKSQCRFEDGEPEVGDDVTFTVPVWLAQDKGLI